MNHAMIRHTIGVVLKLEAVFMLPSVVVALIYMEIRALTAFLISIAACAALGFFMSRKKPKNTLFFAKEGFIMVALSWIAMSIFGALPFVISNDIPNFVDALFETISGFTTTGASILTNVEALNKSCMFWRSFTHWIGGMGVFVLILAILPMTDSSLHILKAESPGPSVGKLVPKIRDTAKILYMIYIAMTLIQIMLLCLAKMPFFDALTISFGSAGTGGFGIKNDSMASYSTTIQLITTIFMILFGVNFNAYYCLLGKNKKAIFKMEEVAWYFIIIFTCITVIAINTRGYYENILMAIHHAAFQVGSVITTTGYSTVNFDLWPQLSKTVMVIIMFIGACAGSTGGGIKVSRIIIIFKMVKQEIYSYIHPKSVKLIRLDQKPLEHSLTRSVAIFMLTYTLIFVLSMVVLAFDNKDMITNFTAVTATLNNIGPGLGEVGPMGSFAVFNPVCKLVLAFCMLAGRLELYPMLIIFSPQLWKIRR